MVNGCPANMIDPSIRGSPGQSHKRLFLTVFRIEIEGHILWKFRGVIIECERDRFPRHPTRIYPHLFLCRSIGTVQDGRLRNLIQPEPVDPERLGIFRNEIYASALRRHAVPKLTQAIIRKKGYGQDGTADQEQYDE